jgi:hypothetical protein
VTRDACLKNFLAASRSIRAAPTASGKMKCAARNQQKKYPSGKSIWDECLSFAHFKLSRKGLPKARILAVDKNENKHNLPYTRV